MPEGQRRVQGDALRHGVLLEVHLGRVVGRRRARVLPGGCRPEEDHGPRHLLEDVAEVLGAHDGVREHDGALVADDLPGHAGGEGGEVAVVDRDRIPVVDLHHGPDLVGRGDAFGHPAEPVVHSLPGPLGDGPDGAEDVAGVRDDVVRRAGVDAGDGDDRRVEHVHPPRHHGLDGLHDLAGDGHGVERAVGLRGVAARAP